ncbi:hypothetical protein ACFWIB_42035 [Streptomyces sp. NPDC127051]|uniref:hypothetical protein n=1 Tax=Streptomyces sp. NPDC127051 TaxID=3347119 RepID=UPI00366820DC
MPSFESKLFGCLFDGVADVGGVEVAADDVGLLLAAAEKLSGFVGEVLGRAGAGGVDMGFDADVEDLVGLSSGLFASMGWSSMQWLLPTN